MSSDLPTTQRALVYEEYNGPMVVKQVPVPETKDDEILVNIKYSGVCHSDLHGYLGDFHFMCQLPIIGGHEGSGIVVKVGSNVKGWTVGDRAGVKVFNNNCYSCEWCKRGHESSCMAKSSHGFIEDGTNQEYLVLRALDAIRIPEGVDMPTAAPVLCAGMTVYKALKESDVKPGQIVVLTGAGGGLGSFAIQYAKAMGMRVLAVDHPSKEQHCKELGAEWFVDGFNTPDIVNTIKELTNGGPHGVVNLAVNTQAMEKAIEYVRPRGTVVFVALPKDPIVKINSMICIFNAITIKGSIVGSRIDVDEAMDFVARGVVKVPYKLVSLEQVPEIYKDMIEGKVTSRAIVDFSL